MVVWFRRDMRLDDNPALYHASRTGLPILPLFIIDEDLVAKLTSDGAAFDFQAECLRDLSAGIERLGGSLKIRRGTVRDVFSQIVEEIKPGIVYFNQDYEPEAMDRDKAVSKLLRSSGIEVKSFHDVAIHGPEELKTAEGGPYSVYTPFAVKWLHLPESAPLGVPARIRTPGLTSDPIPAGKDLGRPTTITAPIVHGGETAAKERWKLFLKSSVSEYDTRRDYPGVDGTSLMSPFLRFGCISAVRMYADLRAVSLSAGTMARGAIGKFVKELIWREFYMSALYYFPFTAERNYQRAFDRLEWSRDNGMLEAWKKGLTGFPFIDAGMRQLNATGWMHNRARMAVASFLTKDLFIDWRVGAAYFGSKLLDIEAASNVGGWQWSASTGADARPMRIFNPTLQARHFDGTGEYIRRWVPELRNVPAAHIHEPGKMSGALQKDIGVIIGKDYPNQIVDHRAAAAAFKRAYALAKSEWRAQSRRPEEY